MTKEIKKEFVELAKKGPVSIGNFYYSVQKLNDVNFEMTDKFKNQLIYEGLYDNSYIGIITPDPKGPFSMEWLPIFGNSNSYVTKHFKLTPDKAINADLRDKGMELLDRYMKSNM